MRARWLFALVVLVDCGVACTVISGVDDLETAPDLDGGEEGGLVRQDVVATCEEVMTRATAEGCPEVVEGIECDACLPVDPAVLALFYSCMLSTDVCDASASNSCVETALAKIAAGPELERMRASCTAWVDRCDGGLSASVGESICSEDGGAFAGYGYGPSAFERMERCFEDAGCGVTEVQGVISCLSAPPVQEEVCP